MTKRIFSIFNYLIFLGIGVFLIWWQVSSMSAQQKVQFVESLRNANYIYLIPVFIMAVLSHLSRALRWRLLLQSMDYHPSVSNTFYATLAGYFANNFVPRAGELVRCTMLTRYEKIPFARLFGTVLTERLFDLICYVVIIVLTIVVQLKTLRNFIEEKTQAIISQQSSVPLWLKLTVLVCVLLVIYLAGRWFFKKFAHLDITIRIKKLGQGLKEGALAILKLKRRRAFLFYTFIIWATYLLQVYVGFNALSETAHLSMGAALSILSLTTFAMIISPGGIGAFPVAVQQILLIYDVDNISFGWLMWGANTAIIIVLGIASFALLHFQNRKKMSKDLPATATT